MFFVILIFTDCVPRDQIPTEFQSSFPSGFWRNISKQELLAKSNIPSVLVEHRHAVMKFQEPADRKDKAVIHPHHSVGTGTELSELALPSGSCVLQFFCFIFMPAESSDTCLFILLAELSPTSSITCLGLLSAESSPGQLSVFVPAKMSNQVYPSSGTHPSLSKFSHTCTFPLNLSFQVYSFWLTVQQQLFGG